MISYDLRMALSILFRKHGANTFLSQKEEKKEFEFF